MAIPIDLSLHNTKDATSTIGNIDTADTNNITNNLSFFI